MAIAVDLDGTLAHYDGWKGPEHIGLPVPKMMRRVKRWIEQGEEVVIFTARLACEGEEANMAAHHIRRWLVDQGLPGSMEVTCIKKMNFEVMFDDRAVHVEKNTGIIYDEEGQDGETKEGNG